MDFKQGFNREQLMMFDFESMVCIDSWARVVDLFVGVLPLKELGFKDVLADEGRPPFHSSDLLKLYLYGYKNGIRSSRKLAKACKVNLEVILNVLSEVNMMMICYNLRRIMSIFGVNELKNRLKDLDFYFSSYIESFLAILSLFFLNHKIIQLRNNQF